jgi:hypothetical protein
MNSDCNRIHSTSAESSRIYFKLTGVWKYLLPHGIIISITVVFSCFSVSWYRKKAVSSVIIIIIFNPVILRKEEDFMKYKICLLEMVNKSKWEMILYENCLMLKLTLQYSKSTIIY